MQPTSTDKNLIIMMSNHIRTSHHLIQSFKKNEKQNQFVNVSPKKMRGNVTGLHFTDVNVR